MLQEIAGRAIELCRAEWGYIFLRDGDVFRFAGGHGGTAEQFEYETEHPSPISRGTIVGRVALAGSAVQIRDVRDDAEYTWPGEQVGSFRTLLGVPVHGDAGLIGVLAMARNEVAEFSDEEIDVVSLFADQVAVAIQLARLVAEEHEAVVREAAVRDVLQQIARSALDLDEMLQVVIDRAVELCHADIGNIARRDGEVFRVAAFTGFEGSDEYERLERSLEYRPDRGSTLGRTLLTRQLVHIPDVLADPDYAMLDVQKMVNYRSMLGVPMLLEGEPVGVISVARRQLRPFSDADARLLQTFAEQAAIAVRVATLFQTVERQRTELARFAPQAASLLSSAEGEALLLGHRREISALFCDLRGFTAFAEMAEPEEVLGVLREYHAGVGELAVGAGGTVEHFAGDGLMIFFNDPTPVPEHPLVAVRTALAMRERFDALAASWRRRGYELGLGIGVAVGYATLGRIGFAGRYDYGGVGNVVILASRLSSAAEPGQILVTQRAHAAVEEQVAADAVDPLTLKGFSRPVPAYAVRALRDS